MIIHSDRSRPSEVATPVSNESGSENRLSELVRLVDRRKRMIQEREKNMSKQESPNAKSDRVVTRAVHASNKLATAGQPARKDPPKYFEDALANADRLKAALL